MTETRGPVGRSAYLLGQDHAEWERLADQHLLWRQSLLEPLEQLGLGPGSRVLEVGCGPGALLVDLAARVGPGGRVRGLELDPGAVVRARRICATLSGCTVEAGDLYTAGLGGPHDFVVARWVFSFLVEPQRAIDRLAGCLAPGGHLVIQDYNHDGIRLYPDSPAFREVVAAFRQVYRDRGGDLWIAERLPGLMKQAGLSVVAIEPVVKAGGPQSPPFRWVERFLHTHIDTVVTSGHLSPESAVRFRAEWATRRQLDHCVLFSPMQVTVSGRRASG